jgi:PAS domain S-box-containing protein
MGSTIRLLHVDDSEDDLLITSYKLKKHLPEAEIEAEIKPEKVLHRIRNHEYDCIISDYQMPRMNGLELLKELRDNGYDVPFILLTGQGNEEVAAEALRCGANDYYTKDREFAFNQRLVNDIRRLVQESREKEKRVAAEERLQSIIENVHDIIYRLDAEGRITFISPSIQKYGYDHKSLIGKSLLTIVHPDDRPLVEKRLAERRAGERRTQSHELRLITMNQGQTEFEMICSSLEDKQNQRLFELDARGVYAGNIVPDNFSGTQGILRDISDRKRAEEMFRITLRAIPGIFYLFEKTGPEIEDMHLILWNEQFEQFTNFSVEELQSRTIKDWFDSKQWELVKQGLQHVFEHGRGELVADLKTREGEPACFHFNSVYMEFHGSEYLLGVGVKCLHPGAHIH